MMCRDNQCVNPDETQREPEPVFNITMSVTPDQVRGCEVVLRDEAGLIKSMAFDATVRGQWMRRDTRVALAFIAHDDTSIATGAITVEASVDSLVDQTWSNLTCVDRNGAAIPDAAITFN